jgi:hypothetical protein
MADQGRTKLVFSEGAEVLVTEAAADVQGALVDATGPAPAPFPMLTMLNGHTVFVNANQVAYVEDLG